ncbi:hypothetical protein R5R35_008677 [Gryllus longicercus]|uniref:Transmembrane protein 115 n=1 Tax=Gryllus longicercus TaxID=2509291 RepID=A0AAN9UZY2_9ORTH
MASGRGLTKNMPFITQQFVALLGNTSTSVKCICVVVLCGYCLSYSEPAVRLLSFTPGFPLVSWIWTSLTFCFLELHFWEVCVDIITVGLCGKLIEPLWGALEMMTFFVLVNICVAILSGLFYLILYMCTFNTDLLFTVHIHGLAGYIAGVSVAVKQIMPNHVILKTPLGKLTNRNVPLSVFCVSLLLWAVGVLEGTYPTMFMSGLLVSWTYLRFYQRHSNGTKGDMADNFSFASFFPNVLQPPIAVVCNTIHGFLVRIGICHRMLPKHDVVAPSGITISLPGIDSHDMERRRLIALKALNERLSKVESDSISRQSKEPYETKHISQCVTIPIPKEEAEPQSLPVSSLDLTTPSNTDYEKT